ncbi:MAG TPA: hypothetical protein VIK64_05625 [Anaerolineales bacterium]|jgi:hypothetical protein
MEKKSLRTGKNPKVIIEIQGDLELKGWEETEVVARAPSVEDLALEEHGEIIVISCQKDCKVTVPYDAALQINFVHGNAALKSLDGHLNITEASGQLTLRSVGPTQIDQLHGNLTAKNVAGDLKIHTLDGNATIQDVQGDFIVEDAIYGNLGLDDVDGNASASVKGNITLLLDPARGKSYRFESDGNIVARLPGDSSATIDIPAATHIMVSLPGVEISQVKAPYNLSLGDGDADLTLSANGKVILGSQPRAWGFEFASKATRFDFEPGEDLESMTELINRQVDEQIQAQIDMLEATLESQLESISSIFGQSGLSSEKAERIAGRARTAGARAQEKLQRAQEKLQRKLEAARRRAERRTRTAAHAARDRRKRVETTDWMPPKTETKTEPVKDEERLMVLQMLEQGKITLEEAEQLLSALEG